LHDALPIFPYLPVYVFDRLGDGRLHSRGFGLTGRLLRDYPIPVFRIVEQATKMDTNDTSFCGDGLGRFVGDAARVIDNTVETAMAVNDRVLTRFRGLQDCI